MYASESFQATMKMMFMFGVKTRVVLVALLLLPAAFTLGASRKPVSAAHGMVVSADSFASAAGADVLRKGGNAVDAAVAMGFVMAVTYPEAGNIGGGGFMLIRMKDGRTTMMFREKAPAAASRNMFLDLKGDAVPGLSQNGTLSAGVPGTVAGLLAALERYGTREAPGGPGVLGAACARWVSGERSIGRVAAPLSPGQPWLPIPRFNCSGLTEYPSAPETCYGSVIWPGPCRRSSTRVQTDFIVER